MPVVSLTKSYADGLPLTESELDDLKSSIETALNTTKLDYQNIQNAGIATANYAAGSVDSAALGSGSVTTVKIADANVTTAKLALLAVTTGTINDQAVTGPKIQDLCISTGKLIDSSVTTAKIANLAVTTGKINDLGVTTGKLADQAVTAAKIADYTITAQQIASLTVGTSRISDDAIITAKILDGNVTTAKVADSNITTAKIADSNVTLAKLAAEVLAVTTPAGIIAPYGGTSAPTGWLLCDGTSYARATYSGLFSVIGTAFGAPSGTEFNVPDLRGRFLRGRDGSMGRDPDASSRTAMATGGNTGDAVGSIQSAGTAAHTHSVSGTTGTQSDRKLIDENVSRTVYLGAGGGSNYGIEDSAAIDGSSGRLIETTHTHDFSVTSGSTGGNETRPLNANVNYIIKT